MATEQPIGTLGSGDEENVDSHVLPLLCFALLIGAWLGGLLALRQLPCFWCRYYSPTPYSVAAVQIFIGIEAVIAVALLFSRKTRDVGGCFFVVICSLALTYYLLVKLMSSIWPGLVDSWS